MTVDRVERRLAAILAADVVGSSRLVEADETYALSAIDDVLHNLLVAAAVQRGGRLIKTMGDGALLEFSSPVEAVACAAEVQSAISERTREPEDRRVLLRIGVNVGDVVARPDGDLYGDGVNVAVRLEGLADPGGIAISAKVHEELHGRLSLPFEDGGEQMLKNISRQVRVYLLPGMVATAVSSKKSFTLDRPSIAVLPFTNMSADPEQDFFSEGIAEDIITELSRISSFFVIARSSSFMFKGSAADIPKVGRDLGVRYVVEGSVRRMGNRLRITAQLIEAPTGAHIWADRYDRDLSDLFEIQDEVVRSIVASTQTQVVINEGALVDQTARPELHIWELAKQGWRKMYELTAESMLEARSIGWKILSTSPKNAKGHQLIAVSNFHLVYMDFADDPVKFKEEALQHASEAILLDRRDEYSFWILGMVLGTLYGRLDESITAYRQALDLNPNFSLAYGSLGTTLAVAGHVEESIQNSMISMRLNPRDPSMFFRYSSLSLANFLKGSFEEARDWADRAVARKPDWWLAHALLAASRERLGDHAGASAAVARLIGLFPTLAASTFPISIQDTPGKQSLLESLRAAGLPD